jgi:hypothetical protein
MSITNIHGLSITSRILSGYNAAGRNPSIIKYAIKNPVMILLNYYSPRL